MLKMFKKNSFFKQILHVVYTVTMCTYINAEYGWSIPLNDDNI